MKRKSIILILIVSIMYSCGSKKAAVNRAEHENEINAYAISVDKNTSLKKEVIEGALTDADGFNDIGTFKYVVYFDEKTKELFKIENVEKTEQTISETYHFREQELVRLKYVSNKESKRIYLMEGRVVSEVNTTSEDQQLLIKKANRFYSDFKKNH